MTTPFWLGLALGLLPTVVWFIDRRLAEFRNERGPIGEWFSEHTWRARRKFRQARGDVGGWLVQLAPVAWVLSHRRWRVIYSNHCMYGDRASGMGWDPYKTGESWHWTERGADWRRRRRPIGWTGMGGSITQTEVVKRGGEPVGGFA